MQGDCRRALWLSFLAAITDAADGFLARRLNRVTRLGAYLDPIADKFLLTSLYICFAIAGLAPVWLVWLVAGRDLLIVLLAAAGLLFTRRRDYPPSIWGKVSTVVQVAGAVVFLTACAYPQSIPSLLRVTAEVAVTVFTAWSGAHYVWRALTWARA